MEPSLLSNQHMLLLLAAHHSVDAVVLEWPFACHPACPACPELGRRKRSRGEERSDEGSALVFWNLFSEGGNQPAVPGGWPGAGCPIRAAPAYTALFIRGSNKSCSSGCPYFPLKTVSRCGWRFVAAPHTCRPRVGFAFPLRPVHRTGIVAGRSGLLGIPFCRITTSTLSPGVTVVGSCTLT